MACLQAPLSTHYQRMRKLTVPRGTVGFEHTTLQVSANPGLKIMIYRPYPETDTASKLRQLLETAAPTKQTEV